MWYIGIDKVHMKARMVLNQAQTIFHAERFSFSGFQSTNAIELSAN